MTEIASLKFIATNYKIAWELLEQRFGNSKHMQKLEVKGLFELPTMVEGFGKTIRVWTKL